ncbi:hypothetical protein LZ575_12645 [Antarcticibacterium sp. 1MA-6-2]|uniref:hypothetical protein n=1 Tax=Antarcticibacterium sp. 1MA-6-2 TaxID=2908210 RepID=UPI001F3D4C0D|nr:hypothetical protein [Antarcticibacterium sp. 1MA-6-2]UJH89848.1 hypothetical protein LZ575_12645 [Antarcticibacterium sp. 1MA-6-2]
MRFLSFPAVFFLLLVAPAAQSQMYFSGEASVVGFYSSQEDLPFWLHHNKRGRVSEETNISTWISGKGVYELDATAFFEVGAGVLFHDGFDGVIVPDELYGHFENLAIVFYTWEKAKERTIPGAERIQQEYPLVS